MSTRARVLALIAAAACCVATTSARVADAQATAPVIHVGVSTFEAHGDAYYAQELGLFKKAGLNVDLQQYQGGEAMVAGVVAGAVQFGGGNPLPLALAHERGLDVVLVASGTIYDASMPPVQGLVVSTASTWKTGKDLNGKTVAVNTLHSLDQISVEQWVDLNGGDASSVKFLEIPNITMADAVAGGRVDAAMLADPGYRTSMEAGKVRVLAQTYTAIAPKFMIAAWFGSKTWADKNPDIVHKFAGAINDASAWAVKNPDAAAAILRKYMRLASTRASERHANTLDPALVQPLVDTAVRYKLLPKPLDVRDLIWH